MKAMKSEIKENVQGANSDGKENGPQINGLEQKEERNIQPQQNEEMGIQNNEKRLRNLQDFFQHFYIWIIGVPEGEEEEQEIENLFEQMRKKNFPRLAKAIGFQEVQEAQRVPNKLDSRRNTSKHIIITSAKIKDKERILKPAREKETLTYKGVPIRLSADCPKETLQAKGAGKRYSKSWKARTYIQDHSIQQSHPLE